MQLDIIDVIAGNIETMKIVGFVGVCLVSVDS